VGRNALIYKIGMQPTFLLGGCCLCARRQSVCPGLTMTTHLEGTDCGLCEVLRCSSNCCLCECTRGNLGGASALAMAVRMATAVAMRVVHQASLGDVFGPNKPVLTIGHAQSFGQHWNQPFSLKFLPDAELPCRQLQSLPGLWGASVGIFGHPLIQGAR